MIKDPSASEADALLAGSRDDGRIVRRSPKIGQVKERRADTKFAMTARLKSPCVSPSHEAFSLTISPRGTLIGIASGLLP